MDKKISRPIAGAILTACDNMGIDKAKVALNRAAQGGHMMVIPPTEPKEKPKWAETEEEREERELQERVLARRERKRRMFVAICFRPASESRANGRPET